jgi:predicted DNA-binding WGR domain protein
MTTAYHLEDDIELRLIDPARNAFRLYGLTACKTLFGEPCLRIQWGRIGNRRVRERSETFADPHALEQRRQELLVRRHQHGYQSVGRDQDVVASFYRVPEATARQVAPKPPLASTSVAHTARVALQRDIVEAHGLPLRERTARQLVDRWYAATTALASYLEERRAEHLDLVDVSTLAAMYVEALAS